MANFFQQLFGGGKKQQATDVYMPSQDPRYQLVQKNLEDIIAKRGIGYDPTFLSGATAPYATGERNAFTQVTAPAVSADASARGLGRSTIPVNRLATERGNVENRIAQRVADVGLQNENVKAQQYQNALSGEEGLASAEIAAKNQGYANASAAQNANIATDNKMMQNVGVFGANALGPLLTGISPALAKIPLIGTQLSDLTKTIGSTTSNIMGAQKNGATMNIAKNPEELLYLKLKYPELFS